MKHGNYHEFSGDTEPYIDEPKEKKKPVNIIRRGIAMLAGATLLGAALKDGESYRDKRDLRIERLETELKDAPQVGLLETPLEDPDREEKELQRRILIEKRNELAELKHSAGRD